MSNTGWVCPSCGTNWSPYVEKCSCKADVRAPSAPASPFPGDTASVATWTPPTGEVRVMHTWDLTERAS